MVKSRVIDCRISAVADGLRAGLFSADVRHSIGPVGAKRRDEGNICPTAPSPSEAPANAVCIASSADDTGLSAAANPTPASSGSVRSAHAAFPPDRLWSPAAPP
jgi:hypothetical protein